MLGILLLCLGIGSLLAMFFTGMLSSRFGTRPVILISGFGLAAVLPWLAIASTPFTLGITLLRQALLPDLPVVPSVLGSNIVGIALLTWVLMPWLTRRLDPWLRR